MIRSLVAPVLAAGLLLTTACTDNTAASGDARTMSVKASDTACEVSSVEAPSGTLTFKVTNEGSKINEFYLLGEDGLRIVAEVENIGPGLTRDLVLSAPAGTYFTACKPGMVGEGIRGDFTVTDSGEDVGPKGEDAELVAEADKQYASYVRDQVDQLVTKTEQFATLVKERKDDEARAMYADARVHWERVETVAESFGDLDPQMDAREADLEAGDEFTGWHRLEKDLWPARAEGYTAMTDAERATVADKLVADTATLYDRTRDMTFTASDIANGAKGLLDEVATGKVTGEEEYWSRTDLWDFQANVDGAKVAWEGLRPLLQRKDSALDGQIEKAFASLQALLDKHRDGEGFVTYDKLSEDDIKQLADAVNTLSEPLSKMAGAILS
ncbi:PbrT family lead (Pb2+) uptake porter [Tessaracoccus aquimaris]|uniref:PbrT family lead (Pb2+) uptake porter n=1 Tax=Tessaracoccus aquimaris TaxID=1332264 RepID=A0A1Q2CR95_9ACTN|nr:iron uptake system protein EfeO [Tessaracoccus aquimaris]AQP48636.1 PbrT family lead (Pb2+) uptake porter [Tessaracoccus aquimaris]